MLGLERGSRIGLSKEEPPYFPEEDDLPPARDPNVPPTYAKPIGTVAGRDLVARRWKENEPIRREILDSRGIPLRQRPLIARVLGRGGGLHTV
uniref:Complex I-B17 n=1 Tax=Caenorhabditis tropicalis TaxID=1561998 RepID=A0A1I7V4Q4_9PELO